MVGGGSDISETSNRLGLPADLLAESEQFQRADGVYPDNAQTVGIFSDMMTQWRMGPAGATGLDYNALPVVLMIRAVTDDERQDVFDGLRVMEMAALKSIRERRKNG